MIIDGHAHACGELHNINGILTYLSNNQIDKVVLCPGEPNSTKNRKVPMVSEIINNSNIGYGFNKVIQLVTSISGVAKHIDAQNEIIACMANEYPEKIIQAYWVNPLESNCIQKLENSYLVHNFSIIKMHQCWHNFDVLQNTVENIIQWSLDKYIPIFIHLLSKEQCIKFTKLTNKYPNVIFIIGHMIGFNEIVENSTNENIYFDISAPFLIPLKTLEKAIKIIGSNRLILGSDTPYGKNNIQININRIKNLKIGIDEQENILGNNLMKIIKKI